MINTIPPDVTEAIRKISKDEISLATLLHGLIRYHPLVKCEEDRFPAIVEHIECVLDLKARIEAGRIAEAFSFMGPSGGHA